MGRPFPHQLWDFPARHRQTCNTHRQDVLFNVKHIWQKWMCVTPRPRSAATTNALVSIDVTGTNCLQGRRPTLGEATH